MQKIAYVFGAIVMPMLLIMTLPSMALAWPEDYEQQQQTPSYCCNYQQPEEQEYHYHHHHFTQSQDQGQGANVKVYGNNNYVNINQEQHQNQDSPYFTARTPCPDSSNGQWGPCN